MADLRITIDATLEDAYWLGGAYNLSQIFQQEVQVNGLDIITVEVEEVHA